MQENTTPNIANETARTAAYGAPYAAAPAQPKKKASAGKIAAFVLAFVAVAGAAFAAGAL